MGWVGSGEDFRGLGWVQKLGWVSKSDHPRPTLHQISRICNARSMKHIWQFCRLHNLDAFYDKLYSPQMVVTANTTKYTIENDLTKKDKKRKKRKKANKHTDKMACTYLKRPISN